MNTGISVETAFHDHFAAITFARPPHNFANPALLAAIADAIDAVDALPDMRCMVLLAAGKAFCAGADLAGDASVAGAQGMDAVADLYTQAARLFRRRKPLIAAIQGAAIGAGLGLAVAADFRVAGPQARLSGNFVRLGFYPGFGLTTTLPRLIGVQRAQWMLLSGERVKPEAALAMGLVDRVAGEHDLIDTAFAMARDIAAGAPLAIEAIRAGLNEGFAEAVVASMAREHARQSALRATADYAEGVAAVFERREARFTGA